MKVSFKYILLFIIIPVFTQGQVYLSGVTSNPVIANYLKTMDQSAEVKASEAIVEPLRLPFQDDFSNAGPYPDATKWLDSTVYINAHYPMFPVDYGVATFDVLDKTGEIYSEASIFPFVADYLTSVPIRLDSVFKPEQDTAWLLTKADSVYFSFYYQPQGRGDAPLDYDSLSLQFGTSDSVFSEIEKRWLHIADAMNSMGEPFQPLDTIKPSDTILYTGIDFNFIISVDTLYYIDSIYVSWDSLYQQVVNWKNIWNAPGEEIDSFLVENNRYFNMVMIPVLDSTWYRNDFQFRFYNYGSLSSINSWKTNTDHWHIDKIYLNAGRTKEDIFTREIRFVQPAPSLLNGFTSLPMLQFKPAMIRDSISVYANNNDSISHSFEFKFDVENEGGTLVQGLTGGFAGMLEPYYLKDINSFMPFKVPTGDPIDPPDPVDAVFTVRHFIRDTEDTLLTDTLYYSQVFSNYFAYDDGTAERSYGASADNVKIAVRFNCYVSDTLRGIQIFFNRVQENYNDKYFHLRVWNDNNGIPGSVIYKKDNIKPALDHLNEYYTYIIEDTLLRLSVNPFYVGVIQTTFDNLNIGFDRNNNSRSKTFYNTSATWNESPFDGSLMIRPVMGRALAPPQPVTKAQPAELEIYPNPPITTSFISFNLPASVSLDYKEYLTTRIYDLSGRLIFNSPFKESTDISMLEPGFYIVDILDKAFTRHYTAKLLITK
jgi:hypothetical protein